MWGSSSTSRVSVPSSLSMKNDTSSGSDKPSSLCILLFCKSNNRRMPQYLHHFTVVAVTWGGVSWPSGFRPRGRLPPPVIEYIHTHAPRSWMRKFHGNQKCPHNSFFNVFRPMSGQLNSKLDKFTICTYQGIMPPSQSRLWNGDFFIFQIPLSEILPVRHDCVRREQLCTVNKIQP